MGGYRDFHRASGLLNAPRYSSSLHPELSPAALQLPLHPTLDSQDSLLRPNPFTCRTSPMLLIVPTAQRSSPSATHSLISPFLLECDLHDRPWYCHGCPSSFVKLSQQQARYRCGVKREERNKCSQNILPFPFSSLPSQPSRLSSTSARLHLIVAKKLPTPPNDLSRVPSFSQPPLVSSPFHTRPESPRLSRHHHLRFPAVLFFLRTAELFTWRYALPSSFHVLVSSSLVRLSGTLLPFLTSSAMKPHLSSSHSSSNPSISVLADCVEPLPCISKASYSRLTQSVSPLRTA